MIYKLRLRLTLWFVSLSILLYLFLSVLFVFVFNSLFTSVLNEEVRGLAREIRPSIVYNGSIPTLKLWAKAGQTSPLHLLAAIQLYSSDGRLLEAYGPSGIKGLYQGIINVQTGDRKVRVLSYYRMLCPVNVCVGYLQIQLPTKSHDDALSQLVWTIAISAPFLLAGLGVTGYFFSGAAIQPTENSFLVLRQFMADAGHELTTPITVIQASIETLEKNNYLQEVAPDIIPVMMRSITRMSDLARDLMLLAKMETPQLIFPLEPLCLSELIELICEEFKESFASKNINFVVEIVANKFILAHEESVRALISNLLQNALRYTDFGGTVKVSLNDKNNILTLIVEDTGIGIPKESLPYIFNRFYRVEKSRSRIGGGSGLGLAIVKAVVEAHKGHIKVDSQLSKGSSFIIQFPLLNLEH